MEKSLIDVMWEEIKELFYYKHRRSLDVDAMWDGYQIRLIHRAGKEKNHENKNNKKD